MKSLIVFVLAAVLLASCSETPRVNIKIINSGEKTTVDNPNSLYSSGDTVQVHYHLGYSKWVLDEMWLDFKEDKKVFQSTIVYKAVVIN